MFLLNNCKLLIFSDVRHSLRHLAKMPGIGELGSFKKCPWVGVCMCVCTRAGAHSGKHSIGVGRGNGFVPAHCGPRCGSAMVWGAASMQKCSQTVQRYLATKYQLKHRRKFKKECDGKIPKSRLLWSALGHGEQRGAGDSACWAGLCPARCESASGPESGLRNSFQKIGKIKQMLLININCAINKLGVNN